MPGLANDLNISESGYTSHNGAGVFHGRTFQAGTGITITNPDGIAGNSTISTTASLTDLHTARFIVASSTAGTGANFTTISSAIAAAQGTGVNSTIFLQPGTYTENFSLPAGINISAYIGDAQTPNVTIIGKITMTTAGSVSISGIRLQTNSDFALAVTGSAASIVNLNDCYLNCTNNTGISFTTSSSSAQINIMNCRGNLGTTGIGLFTHSSAGTMEITYCNFTNSGSSLTASTCSAGVIDISFTTLTFAITTSATAALSWYDINLDVTGFNITAATLGGSGVQVCRFSRFASGTASSISIGSTASIERSVISSSNTNAITGAGTINYYALSFEGSSATINSTLTQSIAGTLQGSVNTAPTAGFLGERITSLISVGVSFSNGVAANLTSINLTAGVWDITAMADSSNNAANASAMQIGISTTTGAFAGTIGDQQAAFTSSSSIFGHLTASVPCFRAIVTTTTTYYLVVQTNFSGGASTVTGRISAVRTG